MQKIPTVYVRDPDNPRLVTREITEGCEWVFNGEGTATEKFDGTCCAVIDGAAMKRRKLGWIEISAADPSDKWHMQGFLNFEPRPIPEGTYELVGPKVQKNPYGLERHELWRHGSKELVKAQFYLEFLWEFFEIQDPVEGIVWHHPDGRMAKIKRRDFGLPWPVKT
ncbi:unnamed protein product [marine sediment metagenome]|uniref:RNA ligase domain-containing protein n=1 Tax=marine sediment metagenome TaxID=412755 RepID=X0UR77_9ZZZZ